MWLLPKCKKSSVLRFVMIKYAQSLWNLATSEGFTISVMTLSGCGLPSRSWGTVGFEPYLLRNCRHLMFCFQISLFVLGTIKASSKSPGGGRGGISACSTSQLHNPTSALWHRVEKCKFHREPACKNAYKCGPKTNWPGCCLRLSKDDM